VQDPGWRLTWWPARIDWKYPTAEEALLGIVQTKPEVVLVDINLPGMTGIDCIARLKSVDPGCRNLLSG
jgi:YesN/AraC family two-component response regulator